MRSYYFISICLALLLHIIVLSFLIVNLRFASLPTGVVTPHADLVQAVTVNQQQVQAEIQKLQAERAAKKAAELAQQQHLQQLANQAKQARIAEQQHLDQLKKEQEKLADQQKQQEQAAQHQLEALKVQQAQAQKQLSDIQKQKALAQEKAAAEAKIKAAKVAQLQAEKELQQQIDQEKNTLAAAHQKEIQSEVEKYKALILNAIGQRWIVPPNVNKNLFVQVLIHLAPGGVVLDVKMLQSSGDSVLDRSVITAIWKASPLPVPAVADVFDQFRELNLTVKPEGLMSGGG